MDSHRALAAGRSADDRFPVAPAGAEHAFAVLADGLAGYLYYL